MKQELDLILEQQRAKEKRMVKVVCAWCQKHLGGDPKLEKISHEICQDCHNNLMQESEGNL